MDRSIINYFNEIDLGSAIPVIPAPITGSEKDIPRVSGKRNKGNKLFISFSANPKSDLTIEKEMRGWG